MYPTETRKPGPAKASILRHTPAPCGTAMLEWTSGRLGAPGASRHAVWRVVELNAINLLASVSLTDLTVVNYLGSKQSRRIQSQRRGRRDFSGRWLENATSRRRGRDAR